MSTGSPSVLSSTGSPGQSSVQLSEPYSRLSALAAKNELGDVLLALEAEMDGKDDRADELEAQLRLNETAQSEAIAAKEKEWHESDAALRAEVLRLQRELEQQGQAVEETEDDASEWRIKYEESEIQKIEFEKELITAREAHAQELAAVREELGAVGSPPPPIVHATLFTARRLLPRTNFQAPKRMDPSSASVCIGRGEALNNS